MTFAKTGAPNSRTTQLFINYEDNSRLDGMGFSPFGEVLGEGMAVVKKIYNCGEKPAQGKIQTEGNAYLDKEHPKLSKILSSPPGSGLLQPAVSAPSVRSNKSDSPLAFSTASA